MVKHHTQVVVFRYLELCRGVQLCCQGGSEGLTGSVIEPSSRRVEGGVIRVLEILEQVLGQYRMFDAALIQLGQWLHVSPQIALPKMAHLVWDALVLLMQFTAWLQAVLLEIRQHPGIFRIRCLLVEIEFVTDHHQAGGFSFNDHGVSPLTLVLENTYDGWHVSQILKGVFWLILAQLGQRIIPRRHRHSAGAMSVRTGDITWSI